MKNACLLALAGFVAGSSWLSMPALARQQFKNAFDKKYIKADSADPKDKEFAEAAKTANCNICHVGPNPKVGTKNRNEYGKAFNKLITTKDVANVEKMNAAMDEVATMKSDPSNPASPTYGELIAGGKLPVVNPPAGNAAAPAAAPSGDGN